MNLVSFEPEFYVVKHIKNINSKLVLALFVQCLNATVRIQKTALLTSNAHQKQTNKQTNKQANK